MQDIKDYLSYDPLTGLFTRLKNTGGRKFGSIAGTKHRTGHIWIAYRGKKLSGHRLAWYFTFGEMPPCNLDHINEDPSDNRIVNLRLDINKENEQNISTLMSTNTSGYRGVSWHKKSNKWAANIRVNKKIIYLGCFNTPEEAHEAYLCAKRKYHPFWVENKVA